MRIANSRHAWLRRGVAGVGLAAPLALAPALPVTVCREIRVADSDRAADVVELDADAAPPAPVRAQR
jgi:hypothetical protein